MAFQVVQTFEEVQYGYDREGDVLYLSFGSPRPAAAIQVEDWLAIRLATAPPPGLVGMTIVGFRRVVEKINHYIEHELPNRVVQLRALSAVYDDETDTLIIRREDHTAGFSIFEPLAENVYLEKSLPAKDVVGIKIERYTRSGPAALEAIFGQIIDTIFDSESDRDENARLMTCAVVQSIDWEKLALAAA